MNMVRARGPYRAAFAAMSLTLLVACSGGDGPSVDPAAAATSLEAAMQADRDFAAMAKKDGLKPAFLKYMHATDSKFLQPGVVVQGAEAIAAGFDQSPPDFRIEWTPDGGHGSAAGDLAVTTGLYTIVMGAQTIEKGRYVTVWTKDAAGELKAAMDMSVPDPAAPASTGPTPDKPDFEGRPG
jgi:ketosteroid isomerase-like protein